MRTRERSPWCLQGKTLPNSLNKQKKGLVLTERQACHIHYFSYMSISALLEQLNGPNFADEKIKAQGDEHLPREQGAQGPCSPLKHILVS